MHPRERPSDFHPQDWIIIVEALAQWAGPPDEATGRHERAYELIEPIAAQVGLQAGELLLQIELSTQTRVIFRYSLTRLRDNSGVSI